MLEIVQSPAEAAASDTEHIAFPFTPPRPDGELVELAQGVFWARMPMPMQLDHINVYLLRDVDGWFIVDTGLNLPTSRTLWETIVERHFDGLPLKGLICTHFHYDHAGLSAWLTERFDAPLYMTHGEYFTMRTLAGPLPEPLPDSMLTFYLRAGMPRERVEEMFAKLRRDPFMPPQPRAFTRLREGQALHIGGRDWRVVIGEGHSPEHACLYCDSDRLLIAGDQLLPRITSNVLVSDIEPEANPLKLWLDSLDRLATLAPDTLVLPSHERVFRGLLPRVAELHAHHALQFDIVRGHLREAGSATAFETKGKLFPRVLNAVEDMMALGETIAHLSFLRYAGEVRRVLDDDGLYRFSLAN
ncbi:Beta-lactamase [Thauera humireducens]|jgi:glyoxylase-like metal-dependent hydrolase (beta-lactamase superfamily II)|uniref:MBL fold metallo-hydrolase n=1 Tax=Thauera humireducens TaxID=1134435 RepID=UPI002467A74A|nr:MBL fold metallo-hydrolase [Thauera humireducens]CAH1749308.1 Beta-lactamase [Thauera humireducens]